MKLVDELFGLIDALDDAGVEYAVCGGIALAVHGRPRFTKDIDFLVRAADLERVRAAARARGFVLDGGRLSFGVGTGKERELVRLSKAEGEVILTLDLMLVCPVLEDVWSARQRVEWRGRGVWIVSRGGLVQMKRLAGRPQDLADIEGLLNPGRADHSG